MKAFLLTALIPAVLAQSPVWGQCGGNGWTGATSCASGSCCTFSNEWYSQCIPGNNCGGGGSPTTTTARPATTTGGGQTSPTATTPSTGGGTAGCGKAPALSSGIFSITINGKSRRYTLRVPNNYDRNKQYKVIFGFHWLNGNMGAVTSANYYGLVPLAGESAIFVAPDGLNAGWANSGGEDIAFVDALNSLIDNGLCVNPKQRYATGFSYGGAMSHSVACSRAGVFRAVAVISGALLSGCSGGNTPIAYLGIHGVADSVLNISQGRSLRDKWLGLDKCQATNAPEPARGSGSHIKTVYSGCTAGYPVVWIAHSGDHVPDPRDNNGQYWAPGETWTFFTQNS